MLATGDDDGVVKVSCESYARFEMWLSVSLRNSFGTRASEILYELIHNISIISRTSYGWKTKSRLLQRGEPPCKIILTRN